MKQNISTSKKDNQSGFTLIEFLLTFAILITITGAVVALQRDFFSTNRFLSESFMAQGDATEALEMMAGEIRTAFESAIGGYPIEQATPTQFTFYADVSGDGVADRVSYYISGSALKKSVVKPAGTPLTYSTTTAEEAVSVLMAKTASNQAFPLFLYYGGTYAGTTTPLATPTPIAAIRHVEIRVAVPTPTGSVASSTVFSSRATIRTLKFRGALTN